MSSTHQFETGKMPASPGFPLALSGPLAGSFCAQFASCNEPTKRPASGAAKHNMIQVDRLTICIFQFSMLFNGGNSIENRKFILFFASLCDSAYVLSRRL